MSRDGLLLIDKQRGGTSHDVVQAVRRIAKQKRVGHCGTLDPEATGLLLLTLGQATRLTRFLIHAPKVYEGVVQLGRATDTYDAAGEVVSEAPFDAVDEEAVDAAMAGFVGTFEQTLPAYSARKKDGVKFYEMARRGEEVPEATKEVVVAEFARTGPLSDGRIPFHLSCSSGTYARALAHDVGSRLGCGGHLAGLRRIAIGPFRVDFALELDELASRLDADRSLGDSWYPLASIPLPFPELRVDAADQRRLRHGQTVLTREVEAEPGDWVRICGPAGELTAIGAVHERIGAGPLLVVQPKIVFPA